MRLLTFLITISFLTSCTSKKEEKQDVKSNTIAYTLQRTLPHDLKAFTQGFVIHKGQLFESTGQQNSWIGIVNINTGVADKKVELPPTYFGEGITILNNKIYQLTWQDSTGFVYDLATFKKIKEFTYTTEGWGLTHDDTNLIMSDGTDQLYFMDTTTLAVLKSLKVTYEGKPLTSLNELEYVNGFIYANVWQTNLIAKIDSKTGEAQGFLDLASLAQQAGMINPNQDVLNGIAWHEATQSFLVTGKYWPVIFVLKEKSDAR